MLLLLVLRENRVVYVCNITRCHRRNFRNDSPRIIARHLSSGSTPRAAAPAPGASFRGPANERRRTRIDGRSAARRGGRKGTGTTDKKRRETREDRMDSPCSAVKYLLARAPASRSPPSHPPPKRRLNGYWRSV